MAQTTLTVTNGTKSSVLMYLTLDNAQGNVSLSNFPKLTPVNEYDYTAYTKLEPSGSYSFTSPAGTYLMGSVSFGPVVSMSPPPSDSNDFQFSLNVSSGADEELDIDCTSGVNALISVQLSGGGEWLSGETPVTSFSNTTAPYNTGTGVYPSDVTRPYEYEGGTVAATLAKLVPSA